MMLYLRQTCFFSQSKFLTKERRCFPRTTVTRRGIVVENLNKNYLLKSSLFEFVDDLILITSYPLPSAC